MKLNLEIIRTCLPESDTIRSYGVESRKLIFRRPQLYEPGMEMASGSLYVMYARDLPRSGPVPGTGIICVGERIPPAWSAGGVQLLCLREGPSVLAVFNQICRIYDRFDEWDEQLRDELEKESDFDIGRLLLLGSRMLENPLGVAGQTLQALFNMEYHTDASGKTTFYVDSRPRDVTPAYAEQIKLVCGLERSLTVPYISTIDLPGPRYYCCNLYPMGYFVGCASLGEVLRPFRESDFPLADHFFGYLQKAFFKYLRDNNQTQSPGAAALQKLLRHEPMNDEEKALFQLPADESWIFFKLKEKRGKKYLPKDYMYGTLNALMSQNVYVAMYHKEIVGLIRIQDKDTTALESFGSLLKRMDYFAGLSNRFCMTEQIGEYLLQAHYAVEQNAYRADEESLYFFQDLALDYLLHACTAEMSPEAFVSRNLLNLVDYDQRRGTEYVKTLDLYLQNEMSITKTAEALFIHRTSLMKRLDKLQRMLEDDLSNPDMRLFYRLCLALIRNK